MVGPGSAQVAQSQAKWYQATYDIDGHSVRVQYLSDRALSHGEIVGLAEESAGRSAERRNDFCRIFVDDVGQGSKSGIASWAEKLKSAEELSNRANSNASAEDRERFASTRTLETVGRAVGEVGGAFAETGRRVVSAILPVPTEEEEKMREQARARRGRTTLVAETAAGETARVETAALEAETPAQEAAPATRKREQRVELPNYSVVSQTSYEFQIDYDASKVSGTPSASASFFVKPENRDSVIRFRFRREGSEEWGNWYAGRAFTDKFFSMMAKPFALEVRDSRGEVSERLGLFVDPAAADYDEVRRRLEQAGGNTQKILEVVRSLMAEGAIVAYSVGGIRRRKTALEDHLNMLGEGGYSLAYA